MIIYLFLKLEGEVKDFPGNYTEYREYLKLNKDEKDKVLEKKKVVESKEQKEKSGLVKLTYKEKLEMDNLAKELDL